MRQIVFRGKSIKVGRWLFGDLLRTPGNTGDGVAIQYYDKTDGWMFEDVRVDTVGQFTGLYDKKNKPIYEGDIMYSEFSDGSGGYDLIGWNKSQISFGMMDNYSYQSKQEGYDFPEFKNYVLINYLKKALICEVVGNIYDNPELMNVK